MIDLRPFSALGRFDNDWLSAHYHFSFADYHDSARMGLGPLRVWNDDRIASGGGFPMHPHRDMEIITYIRRGAISHEDHLGNRGRIEAGNVQVMSAGTGILHSEFNRETDPTELFQIWIEPDTRRLSPSWGTRAFPRGARADALVPLASGRACDRDGEALAIHQDAAILCATIGAGGRIAHELAPGRRAYLVALGGPITLNGVALDDRDGAAITNETTIEIAADAEAEIVLADLP